MLGEGRGEGDRDVRCSGKKEELVLYVFRGRGAGIRLGGGLELPITVICTHIQTWVRGRRSNAKTQHTNEFVDTCCRQVLKLMLQTDGKKIYKNKSLEN